MQDDCIGRIAVRVQEGKEFGEEKIEFGSVVEVVRGERGQDRGEEGLNGYDFDESLPASDQEKWAGVMWSVLFDKEVLPPFSLLLTFSSFTNCF